MKDGKVPNPNNIHLKFSWWDKSIEEINGMIPILTCSVLDKVREELKKRLA